MDACTLYLCILHSYNADKVADMEMDKVADKVADMEVDKVADVVDDMEVDTVPDMEVDKAAYIEMDK